MEYENIIVRIYPDLISGEVDDTEKSDMLRVLHSQSTEASEHINLTGISDQEGEWASFLSDFKKLSLTYPDYVIIVDVRNFGNFEWERNWFIKGNHEACGSTVVFEKPNFNSLIQ